MQFTGSGVMVQHLVEGMTSILLTMPTVTLIPTQTLVNTASTLFQVEYKTITQSWLGLVTSHLMRWRCFILAEAVSSYDQFFQKCLSEVSLLLFPANYVPFIQSVNMSTILWVLLSASRTSQEKA